MCGAVQQHNLMTKIHKKTDNHFVPTKSKLYGKIYMARKSYFIEPVRDNTQPWSMAIIVPECSSLCDARLVWKFWSTIFCSVERRGASTPETHLSGSLSADRYTPLLEICWRWNTAGDQSEQMNNKRSSRIILDFLLSDSHST